MLAIIVSVHIWKLGTQFLFERQRHLGQQRSWQERWRDSCEPEREDDMGIAHVFIPAFTTELPHFFFKVSAL